LSVLCTGVNLAKMDEPIEMTFRGKY